MALTWASESPTGALKNVRGPGVAFISVFGGVFNFLLL